MGYTYEQLKQMGATPGQAQTPAAPASNTVAPSVQSTTPKKKYTYQELVAQGATPVAPSPQPAREEKGEGFLKSIVKAPATILARPVQLAAELVMPGDNTEAIDKFSREKLGGFVAPVPQSAADVKKDVGRGIQTAAWGAPGLLSGGTAFGVGSSLEKGNDLFSTQTAVEGALGAGGAKIAGAVAKPILNVASKAIEKVAPGAMEAVSKKTSSIFSPIKQGMDESKLLPDEYSSFINKAAGKTEDILNKPFEVAKNALLPKSETFVAKMTGIENTAAGKKFKQMHGESMDEYLVKSGNIDSPDKMMINEYNKAMTSRKLSEQQMKNVPGVYRNDFVRSAIDDLLEKEAKIGIPGKESKEIFTLANKYKQGGLTFDESNRVKQLYEKNVKLDFLKEKAADKIQRANRIDNGIREWQRETAEKGGYTNLAEMMKQTQKARSVADALYKASLKGDLAKGGFGLFDAVLVSGLGPEGLALSAGRKFLSSDTFRKAAARGLAPKAKVGMTTPKQGPIKDFFLPEPKAGTPKTTQKPITTKLKSNKETIFVSPKGTATPVKQSAVDITSVDLKKARTPKAGRGATKQAKTLQEMAENVPFVNPKKLPKIEMGNKPKISISDTYKGADDLNLYRDSLLESSPVLTKAEIKKLQNATTFDEIMEVLSDKGAGTKAMFTTRVQTKIKNSLPTIEMGKKKINNQKGSALSNLVAGAGIGTGVIAGGAKIADLFNQGKNTAPKTGSTPEVPATPVPVKDLRKGFLHAENRGASASGEDVYKVKGVTGDLGKYQVKPQTLKDWSGPWLGKTYSPKEFLNDPKAQEEFMNQFLAVVDAYELSPEDAAIVWHKGWGVLGDNRPRDEKKKALRKHIEANRETASEYVKTFKEGLDL